MHFLQDRKLAQESKPLSRHRLRVLERQNEEIEQVSSFFLPQKTDGNQQGTGIIAPRSRDNVRGRQARASEEPVSIRGQDCSLASSTGQRASNGRRTSLPSCRPTNQTMSSLPAVMANSRPVSTRESKATTYFTWSSSPPRSPIAQRRSASVSSVRPESQRSTTPDLIREALVKTGIYRGTGINPYDGSRRGFQRDSDIQNASTLRSKGAQVCSQAGGRERTMSPAANARPENQDAVTHRPDQSILDRWENILPLGWRREHAKRSLDNAEALKDQAQAQATSRCCASERSTRTASQHDTVDRNKIADEALVNIQGKKQRSPRSGENSLTLKPNPQHDGRWSKNSEAPHLQLSSPNEKASLTSRGAMPPPPIPLDRQDSSGNAPLTQLDVLERTKNQPSHDEIAEALKMITPANDEQYAEKEFYPGHNKFQSPQGIATENSNNLPSLQSVSWIDATRMPTPALTRSAATSGINSKSPLYVSQLSILPVDEASSIPDLLDDGPGGESMADFIARIESEAAASPPDVNDETNNQQIKYGSTIDERGDERVAEVSRIRTNKSSLDPNYARPELIAAEAEREVEWSHGYQMAPNLHQPAWSRQTEYNDGEIGSNPNHFEDRFHAWVHNDGIQAQLKGAHQSRNVHNDARTLNPTDDGIVENDPEEISEMSSFWRPNYFARF
ncbi:uncharacterized protein BCR38DRAFT_171487 [Pseudomassariella vexata]|uniref:Uncharacterized protein n=1 Tax=Pseudomassariella vexata TaxID=1141098 RepID=A0A1Y2E3U0_9PEZI|nr:uncharacterized protein BCR38DRAFT_171487 [Pseudomassariella vexata]ORY66014.1 hypothetical protein BCR38DRAFT_171487 [Pseudomassariella vexata]